MFCIITQHYNSVVLKYLPILVSLSNFYSYFQNTQSINQGIMKRHL